MKKTYKLLELKSGFSVSAQASSFNYSTPRTDGGPYTHIELGFPSAPESLIIGYAETPDQPTETVYGYVPVGLFQALIVKHGGVESGEHPPFDMTTEQCAILAESLFDIEENNEDR